MGTFVSYSNHMSLAEAQETKGAYIKEVEYPKYKIHQKNDEVWSFQIEVVVDNIDCSNDGSEKALFFFKMYINDALWWNECNETSYRLWECTGGSTITRHYRISVPIWLGPNNHLFRIELYWYNNGTAYLQDAASFMVTCALRVSVHHQFPLAWLSLYILTIFLLSLYLITVGSINPSKEENASLTASDFLSLRLCISEKKLAQHETGDNLFKKHAENRCFFLFFLVFGLWQIAHISTLVFPSIQYCMHQIICVLSIVIVVALIKKESSDFREYGFWLPQDPKKYVFLGIFLASVHMMITVFIPGTLQDFEVLPPTLSEAPLQILTIILTVFASESIFRGYILRNFTKAYGLFKALFISSAMFSMYRFSLMSLFQSSLIDESKNLPPLFIMGIFLGILFCQTKNLVCPVTFYVSVLFLHCLTPLHPMISECYGLFFEIVAYVILLSLLLIIVREGGR